MACDDLAALRNIGIIAHIDAGKTTLTERILFYCRKIHRLGEVHDGAATMDFMPEEQERGITIASACTSCHWDGRRINLIDTPGHVDFTIEVERCLRVLDGAVGVFCAVGGVEPQSETVWRQSAEFGIPKLIFVNKMDRPGADFGRVLDEIRKRLGANAAAVTIPVGFGDSFSGIIDLLANEKLVFDPDDQGQTIHRLTLSSDEAALASEWRDQLLERLADADDAFLSLWLEGAFDSQQIREALARATRSRAITPAFCGSALRNIGVQPLLDGIISYLPSPLDAAPAVALSPSGKAIAVKPDPSGKPLALVFKVVMENGRKTCFLRLYSGTISEGSSLVDLRAGKRERVGRLFRIHADRRERLEELCAGDIAAVGGLRESRTGDTLAGEGFEAALEPIREYAPVMTLALEPRNADEGKILDEALARYLEEDPTLKLELDEETGMRMLSGMGELHLEVVLERLKRESGIEPRTGQPQVVLRETINGEASAEVCFDRELGKERHQGEVALRVAPRKRDSGNLARLGGFLPEDEAEARRLLPHAMREAVLAGAADALQNGLSGWPMADVEVEITGVKKTDGLTTLPGLRMAAAQALREALANARPITLEPIMRMEITCPEDFLGAAINLFNQSGGRVENLEDAGGIKHIEGMAPLRRLFGFATKLRSATQGRAGFMLAFSKFDTP